MPTTSRLLQSSARLRMQDIAGVRIVGSMSRAEQDAIVRRLVEIFPGSRVVDRRAKPAHGHRAVHVIARVGGRPVEVQVRTILQDWWAETVERLGDTWGRQIRYGEGPQEADRAILDGTETRAELWRKVQQAADVIDEWEQGPGWTGGVTDRLFTIVSVALLAILSRFTADPSKLQALGVKHFLIVYDRAATRIVQLREFPGNERKLAMDERFQLERQHRDDANLEIVVLDAPDRETIEKTHGRYFKTLAQLAVSVQAS